MTIKDFQLDDDTKTKILYFKDNMKQLKVLSADDFKNMRKGFRKNILRIIAEGIKDSFDGKPFTRIVLTADEIHKKLTDQGIDVKLTSLYYHLQELEKIGCLEIAFDLRKADENRSGRSIKSFYARSAKIMMLGNSLKVKDDLNILKNDEVKQLISKISGNSKDQVDTIINKILKMEQHPVDQIVSWLEKYSEDISEFDISLGDFLNLIFFLKISDNEVLEGINELHDILDL